MSTDYKKYHEFLNEGNSTSEGEDEFMQFFKESEKVQIKKSNRKEAIWQNIDKATEEKNTMKLNQIWFAAASIAVILIASYVFYGQGYKEPIAFAKNTNASDIKNIDLPDGSLVTLNAESAMTYDEDDVREVFLEGEAFFEVKKGEKFVVKTNLGTVEVLGTSFNVYARNNVFEVSCKTGKVKVKSEINKSEIMLTPGEASFDGTKKQIETTSVSNWTMGEFYFENKNLTFVLEELERQYKVNVESQNIDAKIKISTSFQKGNLDLSLKTILTPLGISYEKVSDQKIVLKK